MREIPLSLSTRTHTHTHTYTHTHTRTSTSTSTYIHMHTHQCWYGGWYTLIANVSLTFCSDSAKRPVVSYSYSYKWLVSRQKWERVYWHAVWVCCDLYTHTRYVQTITADYTTSHTTSPTYKTYVVLVWRKMEYYYLILFSLWDSNILLVLG